MLALPIDFAALLAPLAWSQQFWKATVAAAFVTVSLFALGGLYRARRHLSVLDELPSLYLRMLTGTAVVAMVVAIRHDSIDNADGFLRLAAIAAALLLPARVASRLAVLMARRRRWVEHNAIIVGGGAVAVELARLLRRYPQYGLRFGGFVDVARADHDRKETMPFVGPLEDLEQLVQQTLCDVLIIADVNCPDDRLLRAVLTPGLADCDLWMVPRLREFPQCSGRRTTSARSR